MDKKERIEKIEKEMKDIEIELANSISVLTGAKEEKAKKKSDDKDGSEKKDSTKDN